MYRVAVLGAMAAACAAAAAEPIAVEIGGHVHIRGRYWQNVCAPERAARLPDYAVQGRALGPFGAITQYDWDDEGANVSFVEQEVSLEVNARFTEQVRLQTTLRDYWRWGEDFRSNAVTGADARAVSNNEFDIYQAYIEMGDLFGKPLTLRIGRQEIVLGKGWLVGNMISPTLGLSFDGLRLSYDEAPWKLDAFWAKLFPSLGAETDGDVDFAGVYGTYSGIAPIALSAYYFLVRDARAIEDNDAGLLGERFEDWRDLDDYDVSNLSTAGVRGNGKRGVWDYDFEIAYQFGNVDNAGAGFKRAVYGDDSARANNWATDAEAGYTFDVRFSPRVFAGGAWFDGNDRRNDRLLDRLNPWSEPDASISFNRLFSSVWYTSIFDVIGGASAFSNFIEFRAGAQVKWSEQVSTNLRVAHYLADAAFDRPRTVRIGPMTALWPAQTGVTKPSSRDLGWVATLSLRYQITPDFYVLCGWEHLFAGEGLRDGNYVFKNGLEFGGGTDADDADYLWIDTGVYF